MISHLFVLFQQIAFLFALSQWAAPDGVIRFFQSLFLFYHFLDSFFWFRFSIRLHPRLFSYLLQPRSWISSAKNELPFLMLSTLFFWGTCQVLDRLCWPQTPSWIRSNLLAPLILSLFFLQKKHPHPLFIWQKELLDRLKKQPFTTTYSPPPSLTSSLPAFDFFLSEGEKPHVLFLCLESFRAKNVGALGAQIPLSPRFDALCKEGILWTQFHSTGNLTYACSIASLLGVPPSPQSWHLKSYVNLFSQGLPQNLQQQGYQCALIQGGHLGFDHTLEFYESLGFTYLFGKSDFSHKAQASSGSWGVADSWTFSHAARWLEKQTQPTFLQIFTISNHHPWKLPAQNPSCQEPFLQTFTYTDQQLGRFIDSLQEKGLLEKTILLIFADHGQQLKDRSSSYVINQDFYQDNVHIPLLLYAKGRIPQPQRLSHLACQLDLMPTLFDLLRLPLPSQGFGKSLLRNPASSPLFFCNPFTPTSQGCRTPQWKYWHRSNQTFLYDLEHDPQERHNLASSHPETVQALQKTTREYFDHIERIYRNLKESCSKKSRSSTRHLDLSGQWKWTDTQLEAHIEKFPDLTFLSLKGCLLLTSSGIQAVLRLCRRLEVLHLEDLCDIQELDWSKTSSLIHLNALGCLQLRGAAVRHLPSLRILQIDGSLLQDADLQNSPLRQLCLLQIHNASQITDACMADFLYKNPQLSTLFLGNGIHLAKKTQKALLELPLLTQLHLPNCPHLRPPRGL